MPQEKYATIPCVAYRLILRAKAQDAEPLPSTKYALKAAQWMVGPGKWDYKAALERAVADTQKRLKKEKARRAEKAAAHGRLGEVNHAVQRSHAAPRAPVEQHLEVLPARKQRGCEIAVSDRTTRRHKKEA